MFGPQSDSTKKQQRVGRLLSRVDMKEFIFSDNDRLTVNHPTYYMTAYQMDIQMHIKYCSEFKLFYNLGRKRALQDNSQLYDLMFIIQQYFTAECHFCPIRISCSRDPCNKIVACYSKWILIKSRELEKNCNQVSVSAHNMTHSNLAIEQEVANEEKRRCRENQLLVKAQQRVLDLKMSFDLLGACIICISMPAILALNALSVCQSLPEHACPSCKVVFMSINGASFRSHVIFPSKHSLSVSGAITFTFH